MYTVLTTQHHVDNQGQSQKSQRNLGEYKVDGVNEGNILQDIVLGLNYINIILKWDTFKKHFIFNLSNRWYKILQTSDHDSMIFSIILL